MRRAGSLLLEIARECAVPAGHALAVDRLTFAAKVTEVISKEPLIKIRREEFTQVGEDAITILATGPLTSDALSQEIARLSGSTHLFFYDSISPIVESDSIDMSKVYMAARYDKGTADYINCPMSREEYDAFYDALLSAQSVEEKDWEKLNYFESCLPIEEIARRGRDTLRFGPMKPVGLKDPRTGKTAICRRATPPGKSTRRLLQSGRLPKPPKVRRTGPRVAPDPRPGKRTLPTLTAKSTATPTSTRRRY